MSIDLTLQRIRVLLSHLPPYKRPTCHIAGTNGKGSVSALLSSILLASSPPLTVGRFNSPHLVSILDSIVINNRPVAAGVYAEAREKVERVDRQHAIGASNFELLTSTALMIFEQAALDVVVMEVGMGGKQDATNAIPDECILVSALTAVDLDHQAFLGGSVDLIAREKAGIARRGKPFVMGTQTYGAVESTVRDVVAEAGGELVLAVDARKRELDPIFDGNASNHNCPLHAGFQPVAVSPPCFDKSVWAQLPLHGEHQLANLGVASTIVSELLTHRSCAHLGLCNRITPATLAAGIKSTSWPGRLSYHQYTSAGKSVTIIADGAHNRASALTLSNHIRNILQDPSRHFTLTYVLGLSCSPPKTPYDTLEPLFSKDICESPNITVNAATVAFTTPEGMPWVKPVPPSEIRTVIGELDGQVHQWSSHEGDLTAALDWAASVTGDEGLVVVAGSLYVVADFYRLLPEPKVS